MHAPIRDPKTHRVTTWPGQPNTVRQGERPADAVLEEQVQRHLPRILPTGGPTNPSLPSPRRNRTTSSALIGTDGGRSDRRRAVTPRGQGSPLPRHQQFRDRAKTRVDDLQEIFFGLQSARKESRSADAAVLEEQVQRRLPRILPTAEDITGEALATLVVNKLRGIIHVGADIIQKALQAPASLIANNAGVEGEVVIEKIKDSEWEMGYNVMTDKYENLIESGVTDPAKVEYFHEDGSRPGWFTAQVVVRVVGADVEEAALEAKARV
ncbi:hypothetical protein ZWY2020_005412 [Hordeum vulgare]|nr:hypothetical protein ZWY2020_005412 [Hordeum vulgare]